MRIHVKSLFAACLFSVSFAHAAHAQGDVSAKNVPGWVDHVGEQLGEDLTSSSVDIRRQAMQHIAHFAYFYHDALDLTAAVPTLLSIYKDSSDERSRLYALAALHAIGDEDAMQDIRRYVQMLDRDESSRVQLVTLAALMDHYGEDTFAGDEEAAKLAKSLLDYYTGPRIVVEPPTVVQPQSDMR